MSLERVKQRLESDRIVDEDHWLCQMLKEKLVVEHRSTYITRLSAAIYLGKPLADKSRVYASCKKRGCWNPAHLMFKGMERAVISLAVLLLLVTSAPAQSAERTITVTDATGTHVYQVKKEIFSVRHPVIHRRWRKFRRWCQVVGPVIPVCQFAAQLVTAVR